MRVPKGKRRTDATRYGRAPGTNRRQQGCAAWEALTSQALRGPLRAAATERKTDLFSLPASHPQGDGKPLEHLHLYQKAEREGQEGRNEKAEGSSLTLAAH